MNGVVRGNHHDAWVNGASDPISGLVSELEEARSIAMLVKDGWKPKRTILFLRLGTEKTFPYWAPQNGLNIMPQSFSKK